jgi:ParB-like chromosome segregation protein Spo0J
MRVERVPVIGIEVGARHRAPDPATVSAIAESMKLIGQLQPITVYEKDGVAHLIAGLHRVLAASSIGMDEIEAVFVTGDDIDQELREISENLHRSELTALERDGHVARWIELTDAKRLSVQSAPKMRGRPESGVNAAARGLGIESTDAKRAVKVASLTDEAKAAAVEAGLDNNRTALLEAAKSDPAEQANTMRAIAARKASPLAADPLNDLEAIEKQVAALMSAWNKACSQSREEFLLRIDRPVMDRRFA